jgi:hypothetical protein
MGSLRAWVNDLSIGLKMSMVTKRFGQIGEILQGILTKGEG